MDEALEASKVINDTIGLNMGEMGARVVMFFNLTIVVFFIVSPILGMFGHSIMGRSKDNFFAISSAILVGVVSNVGINYGLRYIMPEGRMSDFSMGLIAVLTSVTLAWLVGRTVAFALAPPGKGYYQQQEDALEEEDLMPFERRRRQYQERRNRILRG